MGVSRMRSKIRNITFIYGGIPKIPAFYRKSRSKNAMVMSDFRPEVDMWPFRARAVKNMQYNPYYRNSSVVVELLWGRCHVPPNVFLVENSTVR